MGVNRWDQKSVLLVLEILVIKIYRWSVGTRECFLEPVTDRVEQIPYHLVDGPVQLPKFINQLIGGLFGFARVDPCERKESDDDEDQQD